MDPQKKTTVFCNPRAEEGSFRKYFRCLSIFVSASNEHTMLYVCVCILYICVYVYIYIYIYIYIYMYVTFI